MTPKPDPTDTADLWVAVSLLTQPQRRPVPRDEPEWLMEIAADTDSRYCNVPAYRAATAKSSMIPSLWQQAVSALDGAGEKGGGPSSPKGERSPADLDLMETMGIIRETTLDELTKRRAQDPSPIPDTVPDQIRRLASLVTANDMDELWWWEYRFQSWARLLETYLNIAEHRPKPVRLRNAACPHCSARQVVIPAEEGDPRMVVPALVIDFNQGFIRAAECLNCGTAWFRGDQLHDLAEILERQRAG